MHGRTPHPAHRTPGESPGPRSAGSRPAGAVLVTARRPAWAGRNFTLLTGATVIANLGSSGALIASAFAVLGAGGSATDVGLVATARTVPLLLFLLIGGALADRLPRHRVMVAANALSCVSQGLFALLVLTGDPQLWQMALLAALGGTGLAFFAPASEGMVLATVSGEQAGRAFAVFRMGMNGANIGGAALGGAMVAAVGPGWVLAIDSAAFALAGALRAFLDVSKVPERAAGRRLRHDLRDGWQRGRLPALAVGRGGAVRRRQRGGRGRRGGLRTAGRRGASGRPRARGAWRSPPSAWGPWSARC